MADEVKKIKDVIPETPQFYPEAPRVDFKDLIGSDIIIYDAKIITLTHKTYGTHPSALLMLDWKGIRYTTISSGQVIVDKVQKIIEAKAFPVACTPTKAKSVRYFDFA